MRISIDIEINESEVDLVTELLSTLRYDLNRLAGQGLGKANWFAWDAGNKIGIVSKLGPANAVWTS